LISRLQQSQNVSETKSKVITKPQSLSFPNMPNKINES
jgi:hypothetical protein